MFFANSSIRIAVFVAAKAFERIPHRMAHICALSTACVCIVVEYFVSRRQCGFRWMRSPSRSKLLSNVPPIICAMRLDRFIFLESKNEAGCDLEISLSGDVGG